MDVFNIIKVATIVKTTFNKRLERLNITVNQWLVIKEIKTQRGYNAKDLVSALNTDKATISQLLKLLEKKGLIERKTDSIDRRAKVVKLTDEGSKIYSKAQKIENDLNNELASLLGNNDVDCLFEALDEIIALSQNEDKFNL